MAYQGSPVTSFLDVGQGEVASGFFFPVDVVNRGKWVDLSQDPNTGVITAGNPRTYRTPWYTQSDLNFTQSYKLNETKAVSFSATLANVLNQRSVTAYNEAIDTNIANEYAAPGGFSIGGGVPFYAAAMHPYSLSGVLNAQNSQSLSGGTFPITLNSNYGKPLFYQLPRTIRLGMKFTF